MTQRKRWIGLAVFLIVSLGCGGLGAIATIPEIDGWYRTLTKPSLQIDLRRVARRGRQVENRVH